MRDRPSLAEPPMRGERLPEILDTLAALRLARAVRHGLAAGDPLLIDAGAVSEAGIAGLQLLAAARLVAAGQGSGFAFAGVHEMFAERVRDAGLASALLDEPEPIEPVGRRIGIRFTDAALGFGGEPLERLRALRARGAMVRATLAAADAPAILADPDRMVLTFDAWIADALDDDMVAALLDTADGSCIVNGGAPSTPELVPVPLAAAPEPLVPVARDKLDAIVSLVGDVAASQAALIERIGVGRPALAAEIADLERTSAALQDGIIRIGMSRPDLLLADAARRGQVALAGGEIEVDRALFERLLPGFAAAWTVQAPLALAAGEDGGFLTFRLALDRPWPTAEPLRTIARTLGGRIELMDEGRMIEARVPRSLTLLDVIILDVGAGTYALPVSHMIEVLRPAPDLLGRFGADRLVLRYRECYVPVVAIGERFRLADWERDPERAVLVVAHAGEGVVALQADAITDQRQIALKPLGLAPPPGVAGAAIIGANRIALVLDLAAFEPG